MVIRRLGVGDGAILRDVRLRALREAPYAFSSWFDRESTNGSDHWDNLTAQSDAGELGVVVVALDEEHCLGMTGAYFADEDREAATLWGMWVEPNARRRGVGRGLVEAVATWARDAGAVRLDLAVTEGKTSEPAAALYRTLGFVETGQQEPLESDSSLSAYSMSRGI